jgi:hypothetical protein
MTSKELSGLILMRAYNETEVFKAEPELCAALLYILGSVNGVFANPGFGEEEDAALLLRLRELFPVDHDVWKFVDISK